MCKKSQRFIGEVIVLGSVINFEQYIADHSQKIRRTKVYTENTEKLRTQYNLNSEQWRLLAERPELMYFDIRKIL